MNNIISASGMYVNIDIKSKDKKYFNLHKIMILSIYVYLLCGLGDQKPLACIIKYDHDSMWLAIHTKTHRPLALLIYCKWRERENARKTPRSSVYSALFGRPLDYSAFTAIYVNCVFIRFA